MLRAADNELLSRLSIFLDDNGTLGIESKNTQAGISLGNKAFSFYHIDDGHVKGESHIPFSTEALIKIIGSFYSA